MTFESQEKSIDSSKPIELFSFYFVNLSRGFYYTNANEVTTFGGDDYKPIKIGRSRIDYEQNSSKDVSIDIETDNEMMNLLVRLTHPENIQIIVYRMQYSDQTFETSFKGFLGGFKANRGTSTLTLTPPIAYMLRSMLSRTFGPQCPYALYDTDCKVAKENFRIEGNINTISGNTITSSTLAEKPDGWFTSGLLVIGPLKYMIVSHTSNTCVLHVAPLEASIGDAFEAYPGCDHTLSTCDSKFSNVLNNGSDPFQPEVNPFTKGVLY